LCDAFIGRPAPEPGVKRKDLREQLPSEREKRFSGADLRTKVGESEKAIEAAYGDFGVRNFLASVNDPSATWVRRVTAAGNEKAVVDGDIDPIDVYYLSDMSPDNADGCSRSLGDPACTSYANVSLPRQKFENPRTLNRHTMLGAASTYEGINTSLLYIGSQGSHFSWHVEDSLLQSCSYLQAGASKYWWFIPASERPLAERVMRELMDPVVLEAAGGDVWTVLSLKACLWPATLFLARGVRVGFHKMEPGDFVVTGYGVLHSGFNAGPNVASAVNIACTAWFSYAMEHAEHWRKKLTIHIPLEKLLVLSGQKLVAGEWWCGDARTYEALEPAQFQRDVQVTVSYLGKYLDDTQALLEMLPEADWAGEKATTIDLTRAPRSVAKFIVDNSTQPEGEPLVRANQQRRAVTDYSVDGTACPHCGVVVWLSVIVCPTCIDQLGEEAGSSAPLCCWRCARTTFESEHDRLRQGSPAVMRLIGRHAPVVVQRLSNRSVNLLVDGLRKLLRGNI